MIELKRTSKVTFKGKQWSANRTMIELKLVNFLFKVVTLGVLIEL